MKLLRELINENAYQAISKFITGVGKMSLDSLQHVAAEMQLNAWFPRDVDIDKLSAAQLRKDIIEYTSEISSPEQKKDFQEEIIGQISGA